jgi:hypothetical protein
MVVLLIVLAVLVSLANSVEMRTGDTNPRDHVQQLHKVSASLRRTLMRHRSECAGCSVGIQLPSFEDGIDMFDFQVDAEDHAGAFYRNAGVYYPGMGSSTGFNLFNGDNGELHPVPEWVRSNLGGVSDGSSAGSNPFSPMPDLADFSDDAHPLPEDWILLHSDVECNNNEHEVFLGTFDFVDACAEACINRDGCTNFIYGKGRKAGQCWDEAITEEDCTEWQVDQYDFYGFLAHL